MLTDPNISFLLLAIGVQAVLIELSSPGGWVAGFIGAVCLTLAVYGLGVLPVNLFGIIFLILVSVFTRYFSWNEYIVPNIGHSEFWKEWYMKIYYPTYTRFEGLSIGVLTGYFFQFSKKFKLFIDKNGNVLLFSGLLSIAFSLYFCRDQYSEGASILGFSFVAASYGILLLGAISASSFLNKRKSFLTSKIALLSYSVYLSHKGVIHLVQLFLDRFTISLPDTFVFFICFSACIFAGILYLYCIEKPSSYLKNKILNIISHEKI